MSGVKSNDTWLSRLVPFGWIGQTKPHHYREILGVIWKNRKELPYAWSILNHGICDSCSLGPNGLRDNLLDGVHLCTTRLKWLKINTMPAIDLSALGDVGRLRRMGTDQLLSLGRLPYPMMRRKGQRGFLRVSWEEALDVVSKSIRKTTPHELAFAATSRGLTNEVYYVFQKLARVLGTNSIDLCARPGRADSVSGLKATLGYGAATSSLDDLIGTDLLVVFGSDVADNHPVMIKYMRQAKRSGARIFVINSSRDRLDGHLPASVISAGAGAKLIDNLFQLRSGGNIAFINGALKFLILTDRIDRSFIEHQTIGFSDLAATLDKQTWDMLEQRSGASREEMQRFTEAYGQARSAVFVYGMHLVQDECGADNVKAIVNLTLARGMLGREKCGIMPIREHSGVQGGGECGSEPDKFAGGFSINSDTARRFSNLWHHPVPSKPGLNVRGMIEAAHRGGIKFLYSLGANLLETMPDPKFADEALAKVFVRIHQDIVLNTSMFIEPAETVVLLPGQTRYEQRTGGTSTSTERRIRFTPEIPGHSVGETLPDWEIPALIGRTAMSNGDRLFPFNDTQAIREEMSRVMPMYQGIEKLSKEGDQLQWGGRQLYRDGFTTMPNNRALFTVLVSPDLP
jgi:molybdopterin-dependent oxidoreductase alpha subunit